MISSPLLSARRAQEALRPPEEVVFNKMLKEPCPYHKGGANHKLKDCHMLKKYFNSLGRKKDDQRKDKSDDKSRNKEDEGSPLSATVT